jgi:hypothetical protein
MLAKRIAVEIATTGSNTVRPANIIMVNEMSATNVDIVPKIPNMIVVTPVVRAYKVCCDDRRSMNPNDSFSNLEAILELRLALRRERKKSIFLESTTEKTVRRSRKVAAKTPSMPTWNCNVEFSRFRNSSI